MVKAKIVKTIPTNIKGITIEESLMPQERIAKISLSAESRPKAIKVEEITDIGIV